MLYKFKFDNRCHACKDADHLWLWQCGFSYDLGKNLSKIEPLIAAQFARNLAEAENKYALRVRSRTRLQLQKTKKN